MERNIVYHINDVPATRLEMNKQVFPPLWVDRHPPKAEVSLKRRQKGGITPWYWKFQTVPEWQPWPK